MSLRISEFNVFAPNEKKKKVGNLPRNHDVRLLLAMALSKTRGQTEDYAHVQQPLLLLPFAFAMVLLTDELTVEKRRKRASSVSFWNEWRRAVLRTLGVCVYQRKIQLHTNMQPTPCVIDQRSGCFICVLQFRQKTRAKPMNKIHFHKMAWKEHVHDDPDGARWGRCTPRCQAGGGPSRTGPAGHSLRDSLQIQVLPFRSPDALADGLTTYGMPVLAHEQSPPSTVTHIGGVDERAQRSFFTVMKRQFIYTIIAVGTIFFVGLWLGHIDRLRVVLQVADLYRLVAVQLDEPPSLIRDYHPGLLLQTLEDCVSARLLVRQQLESRHTRDFRTNPVAERAPETTSPRWDPYYPVLTKKLCWGPSCTGRHKPRTTNHTASSCSCCRHRAPSTRGNRWQ